MDNVHAMNYLGLRMMIMENVNAYMGNFIIITKQSASHATKNNNMYKINIATSVLKSC